LHEISGLALAKNPKRCYYGCMPRSRAGR